jgi:hypothetical protein
MITNKQISEELSRRQAKHDDLGNVIAAISGIMTRQQEVDHWNSLSGEEKSEYFHSCRSALYKKERALKYTETHGLDHYENLQVELGGKPLEEARFTSWNTEINTAISLAHQAKDAVQQIVELKPQISLDKAIIEARAQEFLSWRRNAAKLGDWTEV